MDIILTIIYSMHVYKNAVSLFAFLLLMPLLLAVVVRFVSRENQNHFHNKHALFKHAFRLNTFFLTWQSFSQSSCLALANFRILLRPAGQHRYSCEFLFEKEMCREILWEIIIISEKYYYYYDYILFGSFIDEINEIV